jgi:hypothetical protein
MGTVEQPPPQEATPATEATQADPMAEQRAMWDEAAQVLQSQQKDPVAVLGPRP